MINPIIIAVDAMGGDNSPSKVIEGISIHSKESRNIRYKIFGNKDLINPLIEKYRISKNIIEITHTNKIVEGEDTALFSKKRQGHKFMV